MSDNYTKLPLQSTLNRMATARAEQAIQQGGRALPCQVISVMGSIVEVQFEANIPYQNADGTEGVYQLPPLILPKAESQWLRSPTQVGDFGITQPADTFLGGVSGLGDGVADTGVNYGNMSTLVWVPVGAKSFGAAPDPNRPWINGPKGVDITDTEQVCGIRVVQDEAGTVTIFAGNETIVITSDPSITSTVDATSAGGGATQVVSRLDGPTNTIVQTVMNALGPLSHTLDGVNNKITHAVSGTDGVIQSTLDGAANEYHIIVPTGAKVGLGAPASTLPAASAVLRKYDITAFQTNLLSQRLNDMIQLSNLYRTVGVITSAQMSTILTTLVVGFLNPIPVPNGSSKVFVDY